MLDFPYVAPSGHPHDLPRFMQWLKPGVLLYLGSEVGGCCRTDLLQFAGRQVAPETFVIDTTVTLINDVWVWEE